MVNLRIEVMKADKTHDADHSDARWRADEPVNIYLNSSPHAANGSPVFNNVYVSGFAGTLQDAKGMFLQRHHVDDDEDLALVARRKNVLDGLTVGQMASLDKNGFVNLSSDTFSAGIRVRALNVL